MRQESALYDESKARPRLPAREREKKPCTVTFTFVASSGCFKLKIAAISEMRAHRINGESLLFLKTEYSVRLSKWASLNLKLKSKSKSRRC